MPVTTSVKLVTEEPLDEELILSVQKGSRQAFGMLVRRHSNQFFRVAYRFVGEKQAAEDVVQDAFLKLWEKPHVWQEGKSAKFTTWFYRVVVNMCLDRKRSRRDQQIPEGMEFVNDDLSQDEEMQNREQKVMLEAAIRELPERQQTALNLCFYEELSNREAAEIMGINLKALESLLMRAKGSLKEYMKFYL